MPKRTPPFALRAARAYNIRLRTSVIVLGFRFSVCKPFCFSLDVLAALGCLSPSFGTSYLISEMGIPVYVTIIQLLACCTYR